MLEMLSKSGWFKWRYSISFLERPNENLFAGFKEQIIQNQHIIPLSSATLRFLFVVNWADY